MVDDERFGPALVFGHGGVAAEVIRDQALALPPLNMHLAREVMARTRIHRLLEGYDSIPAADMESAALTLVKVSQLVCDLPEIKEIEINPLLAHPEGVVLLDAKMKVRRTEASAADRLAIRPYPRELEEEVPLPDDKKLLLRPIKPEDEPTLHKLFASLSPEEIRLRFLHPMKSLSHAMAARLTQIDYDREMALVLTGEGEGGETEIFGLVRIGADPDNERAEFAVLLRRSMTGLGLGPMLLRRIIDYAKNRGIGEIYGEVLTENKTMLKLAKALGFEAKRDPEDFGIMHVSLKL
jgi:acetyltransferase